MYLPDAGIHLGRSCNDAHSQIMLDDPEGMPGDEELENPDAVGTLRGLSHRPVA